MGVQINLLGGFSVTVDGRAVPDQAWSRRNAAALVKLLALRTGRRLPRDQVIDLLWPDLLLDEAAPRLHKAAHYARAALGVPDAVVLSGDMVALLPDAEVTVDVDQFDTAARAFAAGWRTPPGRRGDPALQGRPAARRPLRRPGPSRTASAAGCATSSCSRTPAGGTRCSPPTRSTRARTCGWSRATSPPVTATPRCASSTSWSRSGGASSTTTRARRLQALRGQGPRHADVRRQRPSGRCGPGARRCRGRRRTRSAATRTSPTCSRRWS